MRKHGFAPGGCIQVAVGDDGMLVVIKGHHRFNYAVQLGLPVYFVVDNTLTDLYELEGVQAQNWSADDFTYSRALQGDEDCMAVMEYAEAHGVTMSIAASLLRGESAGSGNSGLAIKKGLFKIVPNDHAKNVGTAIDLFRALGLPFASTSSFVAAVSMMLRVPEVSMDHLKKRARNYHHEIRHRSNRNEYLEELEALYNRSTKGPRVAIKLLAEDIARRRRVAEPEVK